MEAPCSLTSMVGVAGFEPTASSSRTKRATKLRYTPLPCIECPEQPGQHSRAQSNDGSHQRATRVSSVASGRQAIRTGE